MDFKCILALKFLILWPYDNPVFIFALGSKVIAVNKYPLHQGPEWDHIPHVGSGASPYAAFWKGLELVEEFDQGQKF